jgi:hypothetical protein
MSTFQAGKAKGFETRDKIIRGWQRFQAFAHATALAVLVSYAGTHAFAEIETGDRDIPTAILTISTILVGLTAAWLYVRFFTDEA